jgi:SsrA-binding protein
MKKKTRKPPSRLVNKKARVKYFVLEKIEAGIELLGPEVKSLRNGRGDLSEAFVKVINGEAFLHNVNIPKYQFASDEAYNPTRPRKLLLHKREVERIMVKDQQKGLTLVPLAIYLKDNRFKVEVGVARGKKTYERKEELKRKAIDRDVEKQLKEVKRG